MKYPLYIAMLLAGFWAGCNKPDDDPAPVTPGVNGPLITVTEISVPQTTATVCSVSYSNVLKVAAGATLQMKMRFQSNRELSQYKIDVHSNFDCHSHGRIAAVSDAWELSQTVNLSGTDTVITANLPVPADAAAGNYDFIIRLLDTTGNEADFVEYKVIVFHTDDTDL